MGIRRGAPLQPGRPGAGLLFLCLLLGLGGGVFLVVLAPEILLSIWALAPGAVAATEQVEVQGPQGHLQLGVRDSLALRTASRDAETSGTTETPWTSPRLLPGPRVGERLVYAVSWFGIDAGTAVMEVLPASRDGTPAWLLRSTVRSNRFLSVFYPIEDRLEALVRPETLQPYWMRSILREGRYRADKEIRFEPEQGRALFLNHRDQTQSVTEGLPPAVLDPLTVFYALRRQPLTVGRVIQLPVFDGHKQWEVVMEVEGRERLETRIGVFDTLRVRSRVGFRGLFMAKGEVTLWVTEDFLHVPVQMHSRSRIGRVQARLIHLEGLGPVAQPSELSKP